MPDNVAEKETLSHFLHKNLPVCGIFRYLIGKQRAKMKQENLFSDPLDFVASGI